MDATTHVRFGSVECGQQHYVEQPSVRRASGAVNLSTTSQNKIVGAAFRRLFKMDIQNRKNVPLRYVNMILIFKLDRLSLENIKTFL